MVIDRDLLVRVLARQFGALDVLHGENLYA